jgi:hypothetical protein
MTLSDILAAFFDLAGNKSLPDRVLDRWTFGSFIGNLRPGQPTGAFFAEYAEDSASGESGHILRAMLRLRKKPPSGLKTINSGEPWSTIDMADLDEFLIDGQSVEKIAEYLCRTVEEVEAKTASLPN